MANLSKDRIKALKNEIAMAKKFNEEELEPRMREGVHRYLGDFVHDFWDQGRIHLNEIYPVVQNHLPAIFFRNPRAFLKPRNRTYISRQRDPITGNMVDVIKDSQESARTQEAILNYQLEEIKYKKEIRRVLLDALLFPFGVLWHGYKGNFGITDEANIHAKKNQSFVKQINPARFLKDPSVRFEDLDEGMWVGREVDVRLEDIKHDKNLNVSKKLKGFLGFGTEVGLNSALLSVEGVNNGNDISDIHRSPLIDITDEDFKKSSASRFLKVQEIYLRPNKKERNEGSNGWILLMTQEQDEPLRISPWTIKAEGFPCELLMFNPVPGTMLPMADIDTYKSIADQKNMIVNIQARNAEQLTKTWIAINKAGKDEEDVERASQGDNAFIFFDDADSPVGDRMKVFSGNVGASSELYTFDTRIERNLQDKSFTTDLSRGFLQSGEESATSVRIRAAGASVRSRYRQDIMVDFLNDSMKYLAQLNKQFVPFDEAVRIVGSLDLEWSSDFTKEDIQADVDVEIDAISMLPENPEEELARFTQTLQLMVQGITDPVVAQKIAQEGKTINLTPLIEQILLRQRIKDPNIFRNINPEESQGFVSVADLRAAQANVQAATEGNTQIPFPPQQGQDHRARLEVYSSVLPILQGTVAEQILTQLAQIQAALLQEEQQQQPTPNRELRIPKGRTESV